MQCDRKLADVELRIRRTDHHLGGELHPGRTQVESWQRVSADRAQPAMCVADGRAVENVEKAGEDRIPDPAQPGHRAGLDVLQPVAHDQLGAVVELFDEARDLVEVVSQIRVDHDDVIALRGRETRQIGAAIAAVRLLDDDRSGGPREVGAPVIRTVVGDDHLTVDAALVQDAPRGSDALLDVRGLVQARDHDGYTRHGRRSRGRHGGNGSA